MKNYIHVETTKVLDWALNHPKRKLAFRNGSDLDIARELCDPQVRFHASCYGDGRVAGIIIFDVDEEDLTLNIRHLLCDQGGLAALIEAWKIYFPDYTVKGTRSKSNKVVIHTVDDFVTA